MICQGKQHPLEDVEHFLSDLVTNFQWLISYALFFLQ